MVENKSSKIYDLIYLDNRNNYHQAQEGLKKMFPSAQFEDGSDEIYHDRFAIKLNDISNKDYRFGLLDLGLALNSLNFQLFLLGETKEAEKLIKEWENANKKMAQKRNQ